MQQENSLVTKEKVNQLLRCNLDFHNQSGVYASHNFHSFPAKFPPQLPRFFINELTSPNDLVLDPMAGSGTTVLEAFLLGRKAYGFDIDPLALSIAKVKTTHLDKDQILYLTRKIILNASINLRDNKEKLQEKFKEKFNESTQDFLNQWFLPDVQMELFALLQEIENVKDDAAKQFFKISFSSIIITKSGGVSLALDLGHTRPHLAKKVQDKYGRTIIGNPNEKTPAYLSKIIRSAVIEFEKRCNQNLEGIPDLNGDRAVIEFGDAQNLPLENDSVDLIVTSPPYVSNAIDYMRAHKFSLVWFGYPIEELGEKRKQYIGGESTLHFKFEELPEYTQSVIQSIEVLDPKKSLVLLRYYSEMKRVLKEMFRVLKPGKASILVVGNSFIRGADTNVPNCLQEIGISVGFSDPSIGVRHLDRDKRMMPVGKNVNRDSQIQQRMHEEYVIGYVKP